MNRAAVNPNIAQTNRADVFMRASRVGVLRLLDDRSIASGTRKASISEAVKNMKWLSCKCSKMIRKHSSSSAVSLETSRTNSTPSSHYAHLSPEVGRNAVLLLDGPASPIVDRSGHDLDPIGGQAST
jgi:hypothetical protein